MTREGDVTIIMKKKKILVLEDNLVELDDFTQLLDSRYEIFPAARTDIADEIIKENNNEIDCIVFDLNMSNEFISEDYIDQTMNGALTGWVWYFYYAKNVLKNQPLIVISSGFVDDFEGYIHEHSALSNVDEKLHYATEKGKKIRVIAKQEIINDHEKVVNEINAFFFK